MALSVVFIFGERLERGLAVHSGGRVPSLAAPGLLFEFENGREDGPRQDGNGEDEDEGIEVTPVDKFEDAQVAQYGKEDEGDCRGRDRVEEEETAQRRAVLHNKHVGEGGDGEVVEEGAGHEWQLTDNVVPKAGVGADEVHDYTAGGHEGTEKQQPGQATLVNQSPPDSVGGGDQRDQQPPAGREEYFVLPIREGDVP